MRVRIITVVLGTLWLAGVGTAQAPTSKPGTAPAPTAKPATAQTTTAKPGQAQAGTSSKPVGNLAQVMRGIFFPNANILFDVQSSDPADFGKKKEGAGASATFSGIYMGWPVVENAAIAIDEGADLLRVPGRLCENGRPVPLERADWGKLVAELKVAARTMYKAAQSKNREAASEATNDVAGACENCHIVYRDKPSAASPRCIP